MEAVRERDPSRQARMALLQAMLNAYGSDRRTAAEMISDAKSGSIGKSGQNLLDRPSRSQAAVDLNAAIVDYTNNKFDAKYLGSKLRTDVGSITAGLRLCCEQNLHTKINNWWVEKA
jgi:hypothetical protein